MLQCGKKVCKSDIGLVLSKKQKILKMNKAIENIVELIALPFVLIFSLLVTIVTFAWLSSFIWIPALVIYLLAK